MAILTNSHERSAYLPALCLIGRSHACDLVLPEKQVSAQHATIEWTGVHWSVRDLGSRNGTYLSGRTLEPGEQAPLKQGAELRFGRESQPWRLLDEGAPVLMGLRLSTGAWTLAEGEYLVLPDVQSPELAVYLDSRGLWVVEAQGVSSPVEDRSVHHTGHDDLWKIYLPLAIDGTLKESDAPNLLAHFRLRIAFTRDEEHVELTASTARRSFDLKARAHHYLVLLLARQRLADRRAGLSRAEQGWIRHDDLLRMLRVDDNHLNISIHRARAQFSQIGVADAAGLIERRPTTRQVRIGVEEIELAPLEAPSGQ